MLKCLKDPVEQVRYFTCEALGKIGDVRSIEPLLEALTDPCEQVRFHAGNALVTFGGQIVLMGLRQAHGKEKSLWLKEAFEEIIEKVKKKIEVKKAIEDILTHVEKL